MIRILIADDHKVFSEAFRKVLAGNSGFQVIAVCNDSNSAIETARKEKPDIVLMDTNIKPVPAVAAAKTIAAYNTSKVIGLSMHADPSYAFKMFGAGAMGYLTKNSPEAEIFEAVRQVANGRQYICSETAGMMHAEGIMPELPVAGDKNPGVNSNSRQFIKSMVIALRSMLKKNQLRNFRRLDV